jgi:ribosome assembly protein 4
LVSASGDKTVRFWDVNIEAPLATVTGHLNAVLVIAWSPNGEFLASGDESGLIIVWEGETHKKISELDGHKKWINGISWEPLHKNPGSTRLASCSKDMSTKVWNVPLGRCECTTSMHSASVTKILWGGQDLIFSTSQDRTVKVWSPDGRIIKELR